MKRMITTGTMIGLFLLVVFLKTGKGEEKVLTLAMAIDLALAKKPTLKAAEIIPRIDPATRTFQVKVDLPLLAGMKSGMYGKHFSP